MFQDMEIGLRNLKVLSILMNLHKNLQSQVYVKHEVKIYEILFACVTITTNMVK